MAKSTQKRWSNFKGQKFVFNGVDKNGKKKWIFTDYKTIQSLKHFSKKEIDELEKSLKTNNV